jgi:hypothetical protein
LVNHFQEAKDGQTMDETKRCTYEGSQKKITIAKFIKDLGLMCDALHKLSDVSLNF